MGDHQLYVRFPDGEIRFGIYYGASDHACPRLYNSPGEAWAVNSAWDLHYPTALENTGEPVQIATVYGNGFWWPATATRDWITSQRAPFGTGAETNVGTPAWLDEYFTAVAADA